jgi:hypothetical protein
MSYLAGFRGEKWCSGAAASCSANEGGSAVDNKSSANGVHHRALMPPLRGMASRARRSLNASRQQPTEIPERPLERIIHNSLN